MNKLDNCNKVYFGQDLTIAVANNNASPYWPKVQVTGAMQNRSQDSGLFYAQNKVPTIKENVVLLEKSHTTQIMLRLLNSSIRTLRINRLVKHG